MKNAQFERLVGPAGFFGDRNAWATADAAAVFSCRIVCLLVACYIRAYTGHSVYD